MCAVNVTLVLLDWDFWTLLARSRTPPNGFQALGFTRFHSVWQIASGFGQTLVG